MKNESEDSLFIFMKSLIGDLVKTRIHCIVSRRSPSMECQPELFHLSAGTVLSYVIDLEGRYEVPIVGEIPAGMPVPTLPTLKHWGSFVQDAFVIALG